MTFTRKNKSIIVVASLILLAGAYIIIRYFIDKEYSDPEDVIVAEVGDQVITVRDLRLNYEFGLPDLKIGKDENARKKSYLNFMINEKLLAVEGYKNGLDKSDRVKEQTKILKNQLAVEALIDEDIQKGIKISDQEIHDAINKSKVSFKFRFWVEPTLERASAIAAAMQKYGYADVVDDIIKNNPDFKIDPKNFQTDYVSWTDISPEILNAIVNLPAGDISEPVKIEDSYFIFQIEDIRRSAVTENDYISQAPTMKKILFNRELKKRAVQYVDNLMTPKHLTTKGNAFRALLNASLEWRTDSTISGKQFIDAVKSAGKDHPALSLFNTMLQDTMVKFSDGYFTIKQFLNLFDPSRINADPKNYNDFRTELNARIAMTMRDHFLTEKSNSENLIDLPVYQKELNDWQYKWVYEEMRDHYINGMKVTNDEIENYFSKYKDRYKITKDDTPELKNFYRQAKRDTYILKANTLLKQKIDSLKNIYPVKINYAVLDTIHITDLKKSRWASVQLFKGGTSRPVVPIVDAAWGL